MLATLIFPNYSIYYMYTVLTNPTKITLLQSILVSVVIFFSYGTSSYALAQTQASQLQNMQQISIVHGSSLPNNANFYDPKSVSVPVGSKVVWTNNDNSFHTVTFVTESTFDSGVIPPGKRYFTYILQSGDIQLLL